MPPARRTRLSGTGRRTGARSTAAGAPAFAFAFVAARTGRAPWVARCEPLSPPPAGFDEDCRWSGSLSWDWTWDAGAALPLFDIQARARPDSIWTRVRVGVQDPVDRAAITALLPGPPDRRHEVRVTGPTLWGVLALEPLTV